MTFRIPWDRYEVALLFGAYQRVANGSNLNEEAVKLSETLRNLALYRGVSIDETFRNVNGMKMQLANVQYLFTDGKTGLSGASTMVRQMYELYENNQAAYQTLLMEATRLTENTDTPVEDAFFAYEKKQIGLPPKTLTGYHQKEAQITGASPWSEYEVVLKQVFPKGFQKKSGLDMKKLRKCWAEVYGKELMDSDEAIRLQLATHCVDTGKRWYLSELLLSDEDRQVVLQYIDSVLASGKPVLYYASIYAALEHRLASAVLTKDLLASYLMTTCQDQYILREHYLTNAQNAHVDLSEEIKDVMLSHGRPIHTDELKQALHHLPPDQVERELHMHPEFIMDAFHVYFHASMAELSEKEFDQIAGFIQEELDDQGYMIGDSIQRKLTQLYPETAERLSFLSWLGVRGAVAYKLRDRFTFTGSVITPVGEAMNMADIFAMFCQHHMRFSLDELSDFAKKCNSQIYMDIVHRNCVRISESEFIALDAIQWNIPQIDAAIALSCPGKYISLKSIRHFDAFPFVGYPWNSYLLEQYVATFSEDFILMHSSFAKNTTSGAVVCRHAGFESFDAVLADVLAHAPIALEDKPCLEFLANAGYITRKRLDNIAEIITRAKMLRSQKG